MGMPRPKQDALVGFLSVGLISFVLKAPIGLVGQDCHNEPMEAARAHHRRGARKDPECRGKGRGHGEGGRGEAWVSFNLI